MSENMS